MSKFIKLSLATLAFASFAAAMDNTDDQNRDRHMSVKKAVGSVGAVPQKDLTIVDGFKHMFVDGKVMGQVRSMYSGMNYDAQPDTYATALGAFLKYELAQYKGFSGALGFRTSYDIRLLSGDDTHHNPELSSSQKEYTDVTQAYINYNYKNINLRAGRQALDTPLADTDDIRMIPNSFEAYTISYESDSFTLMGGSIKSWQGVDADLDAKWSDAGKDGTYFAGFSYSSDILDTNLWFYNINGEAGDDTANNSYYADVVGHINLGGERYLHLAAQYLKQDELDNSNVDADIIGLSAELVIDNIGLNLAYNNSFKTDGKKSFSGFGGGTLFTSMDIMILDAITDGNDAQAFVAGISYDWDNVNFLYAYGDFSATGASKEHIVEQNIGVAYAPNEEFTLGAICNINDDKENTGANDGDWYNVRVLVTYNF